MRVVVLQEGQQDNLVMVSAKGRVAVYIQEETSASSLKLVGSFTLRLSAAPVAGIKAQTVLSSSPSKKRPTGQKVLFFSILFPRFTIEVRIQENKVELQSAFLTFSSSGPSLSFFLSTTCEKNS